MGIFILLLYIFNLLGTYLLFSATLHVPNYIYTIVLIAPERCSNYISRILFQQWNSLNFLVYRKK